MSSHIFCCFEPAVTKGAVCWVGVGFFVAVVLMLVRECSVAVLELAQDERGIGVA